MTYDRDGGPPLTVPIPDRYAACSPICELLDKSVERAAILVIALRHLAHAHHRSHKGKVRVVTWPNCHEHFCKLAHDAIEGNLTLGNATATGKIVSLVPEKEA